jgi:hypothetical protein
VRCIGSLELIGPAAAPAAPATEAFALLERADDGRRHAPLDALGRVLFGGACFLGG